MVMILEMCALEFIPTQDFLEVINSFRETKPFDSEIDETGEEVSKFASAGYETSNYWQLLGAIFFVVLIYSLVSCCKMLCKRSVRSCDENCLTRRLRKPNKYNIVIMRFLLEGCIEIGLSALISVRMIEKETFEDFWEITCILTTFASLFILAVTPCYLKKIQREYLQHVNEGGDVEESQHHELF